MPRFLPAFYEVTFSKAPFRDILLIVDIIAYKFRFVKGILGISLLFFKNYGIMKLLDEFDEVIKGWIYRSKMVTRNSITECVL